MVLSTYSEENSRKILAKYSFCKLHNWVFLLQTYTNILQSQGRKNAAFIDFAVSYKKYNGEYIEFSVEFFHQIKNFWGIKSRTLWEGRKEGVAQDKIEKFLKLLLR